MSYLRLRGGPCGNGINCPAIDRREDGGFEVTGARVERPGLPAHEATVLVPDALLPELTNLEVHDLAGFLSERHTSDLLRVQTLDRYDVGSDDEDFRRYLDGAPEPTAAGKDQWLGKLRTDTAAGRAWRNVHVVDGPLNAYLRYQFEWCYTCNVGAGQDVRVLDLTAHPAAAAVLSVGDFFIVEGREVVRLRYDAGRYLGAVAVSVDAAQSFAALAEMAWQLATPFSSWWAAHPQYHRATRAA